MARWRLEFATGGQLSLQRGVTLVGRHPTCDVVLDDSTVSRRQLLLQTRVDGVELVKLGRQTVHCDELELDERSTLARDGDHIRIGGAPFARVRASASGEESACWLLSVDGGPRIQLTHTTFFVGSGEHDSLAVPGWPAATLQIHDVDLNVLVELSEAGKAMLSTEEAERFNVDGIVRIAANAGEQTLRVGGHELSFVHRASDPRTQATLDTAQSVVLRLDRCGRGGVLTIETEDDTHSVYLARLRFDLISALIRPPPPAAGGDYVAIETLCEQVWPEQPFKTEYDLNVLLHRLRQDLLRARLDITALIERAHRSGLLRAPIARDAKVIVEGEP